MENGYSLVRQDSHGLSRTFDPQGRVLASTDYFTSDQQTMVAYVPTKGLATIYNKVGDVFTWLCLVLLTAAALSAAAASAKDRGRSAHRRSRGTDPH